MALVFMTITRYYLNDSFLLNKDVEEKKMFCPELRDWVFTDHAQWEMARRGITKDDVNSVLNAPEQREEIRPGRCVYQSRLTYGEPPKVYLIRVFVEIDRVPPEVVTVYRTSKVKKYWR